MTDQQALTPQLVDNKGRLWLERTVVVKRDQEGFGFTLSKERPVFVDNVTPGSSADRAGILAGDRIIKVNSVSVVGHMHNEVVEMIRDTSHVTLTVIGKLVQNGTKAPSKAPTHIEISPPHELQDYTLQSLRIMLQKQRRTYESLSLNYSKSPSEKLEKELRDTESIVKILETEMASKSAAVETHIQTTSSSVTALTGRPPHGLPDEQRRALVVKVVEEDGRSAPRRHPPVSTSPSKGFFASGKTFESPRPPRSHTFSNGTLSPTKGWRRKPFFTIGMPTTPGDGSDFSDDDLSDEVDGASEAGPFSSLQELKNNPAHMAVFLHYVFSNKDPKYLLFFLVASSYQNYCKAEALKQRGMDIFWTFFPDNAPLQLEVEESVRTRILNTLESEESENRLRSVFLEVRESLSELIINDLANYRHKRVMGLAGMFGDHMLSNHMSPTRTVDVLYSTLLPDLRQCLDGKPASSPEEAIKNQAMAACVATFIIDTTGKTKDRNVVAPLDRVQTFTHSDILAKKRSVKKKAVAKNGHTFQLTSYPHPVPCDYCGRCRLWGVVYHGYQCTACELNIHRYSCIHDNLEPCLGKKKRRTSGPQRKPSTSTLLPCDEAEATDTREEEEAERLSPPPDMAGNGRSGEGEGERKPRSVSDPKHIPLKPSMSVTGDHPPPVVVEVKKEQQVRRTQSARLQYKPDHLSSKHNTLSSDPNWNAVSCSNSEDSIIGPTKSVGSSLEAIVEGAISPGRPAVVDDDLKELLDDVIEDEQIPWALMARKDLVQSMSRYEIQRQENIRELVYTERTHLQKLKIMRYIYKIPLMKQDVLSVKEAEQLFPSLEELILFHSGLCEGLKERMASSTNGVVKNIADVLLQRFDGSAGERLCHACSVFASNQAKAEKLFKEWKRKNERFRVFIKNAEANPLCQKLTLNELMPIAWQRLTKYKLLISSLVGTYKKQWEENSDADKEEAVKMETAHTCVKNILHYVNKQVRHAENRQRLVDYQGKMDPSPLEKASHPVAQIFKNLDLTAEGRKLIHEGPLTWRIQHRKVFEMYALLLTDVLVLLEREDRDKDRYSLRCHMLDNVSGAKEELSPVIRLKECLLRNAAADRGGRTFLLVNNSSLMPFAQMYEFIAEGPQEKKQWEEAIKRAMLGTQSLLSPDLPTSPSVDDFTSRLPLGLSPLTSHLDPREQLDKIDYDMKKLLTDKLSIIRAMQSGIGDRFNESLPPLTPNKARDPAEDTPKEVILTAIQQAGEISSTLSHIMVPNPTKNIIAETQWRLNDVVTELQRTLSRLLIVLGEPPPTPAPGTSIPLILETPERKQAEGDPSFSTPTHQSNEEEEVGAGETIPSIAAVDFDLPSLLPEGLMNEAGVTTVEQPQQAILLPPADGFDSLGSVDEEQGGSVTKIIVAPPDSFSGDDSATPTPQLDSESMDNDTITPRASPVDLGPTSPMPISPGYDEVEVPIEAVLTPKTLEPPSSTSKRDSIGPGIRIISIISSSTRESNQNQKPSRTDSVRSYTLSKLRHSSSTSLESESEQGEMGPARSITEEMEEEGTDL